MDKKIYSEYKMIEVSEGGVGILLFGASGLPLKKIERILNKEAARGWQLVFQVIQRKRFILFWVRESLIITFGKV